MDELIAICRQFDSLGNNVDELTFALHFSRIIQKVIDLLEETMIDQRDLRDTNEFYTRIYDNISQLRNNLGRYMNAVFEYEIQRMHEEQNN